MRRSRRHPVCKWGLLAVGNLKQLLRHRRARKDATGAYLRVATPEFRERRRRIVRGGNTELGTLVQL